MRLLVLAGLLCALLLAPTVSAQPVVSVPATDGPGALSHFDLARKDCIGTARNTTSRVWFTLADGVLSDVYYPTLDNTNVETMQYIVTDGSTFTDLQTRDMTYSVTSTDPRSLSCEVTTLAKSGKYKIISQYVTDPDNQTLLMRVRFVPLVGRLNDFKLYVRLDPTINGNGGGGADNAGSDDGSIAQSGGGDVPVACDLRTTSNAVNRDYAQPVCSALAADAPFLQVSNGFVGQPSDGLGAVGRCQSRAEPNVGRGDWQSRPDRQNRPGARDGGSGDRTTARSAWRWALESRPRMPSARPSAASADRSQLRRARLRQRLA